MNFENLSDNDGFVKLIKKKSSRELFINNDEVIDESGKNNEIWYLLHVFMITSRNYHIPKKLSKTIFLLLPILTQEICVSVCH